MSTSRRAFLVTGAAVATAGLGGAKTPQLLAQKPKKGKVSRADILAPLQWVQHPRTKDSVTIEAVHDQIAFKKTINRNGSSVLVLRSGKKNKDATIISVSGDTVQIVGPHGAEVLTVGDRTIGASTQERVRQLLSHAGVQRFYALTAALAADDADDDVLSTTLGLSGSAIRHLDGDIGAVRGFAKRLAGPGLLRVRPAQFSFDDCVNDYMVAIMRAYMEMQDCWNYYSDYASNIFLWFFDPCTFKYMLQCESYTFQLIACSALPIK